MIKTIPTTDGIITGRNGTVNIKAIEVFKIDDNLIRIDGISQRKGICINGGLSFDVKCARELSKTILEMTE